MGRIGIMAISLLVALVLLIGMGVGACGGGLEEEAAPPAEEEEVTAPPEEEEEAAPPAEEEEVTPPPEEEEEAAAPQYPWKSILILKHEEFGDPTKIGANLLEVTIDLGREFSSEELNSLRDTVRDEVKLLDSDGQEYHPIKGFAGGALRSYTENDELVFWRTKFAYSFQFKVPSKSSTYTLSWPDYPPLEIGNPFESPFCLGCE